MSLATFKNTSATLQGKTPEQYMKDKGFVSTTDTNNTNIDFYSIENGKIFHYGYKHKGHDTGLAGDMGSLCKYDNIEFDTVVCPPVLYYKPSSGGKKSHKQTRKSKKSRKQTRKRRTARS